MNYTKENAQVINGWVTDGWEWGIPISSEIFAEAKQGRWEMVLTPNRLVPKEWFFSDLKGKKILGLASGGGQQMPIFAALGAECTVLDYSEKQIQSEKMVADREGYSIEMIQGDMTQPLPFADETFDLIFHPVSNCYIEEVQPVWEECFRILKPGGRLLAGLDNGMNFIFDEAETTLTHKLPFNLLKDLELLKTWDVKEWGYQFSHTLDEQIRGQLKAGFKLLDLYEDTNGQGRLHDYNIPSFWATCGEK